MALGCNGSGGTGRNVTGGVVVWSVSLVRSQPALASRLSALGDKGLSSLRGGENAIKLFDFPLVYQQVIRLFAKR